MISSTSVAGTRRRWTRRQPRPSAHRVVALLLLWASVAAPGVEAQQRPQGLARLFHQAWGVREGVPGSVMAVTQTSDGYLWLATGAGLYRFDGVRFDLPQPVVGPRFRDVTRLLGTSRGGLWMTHRSGGVSRLADGRVMTFAEQDGVPPGTLWDLAEDRDGGVWVLSAAGVARWFDGRWEPIGSSQGVERGGRAVLAGRNGAIWIGTAAGILVRPPGASSFVASGVADPVGRIAEAPDGSLWAWTLNGRVQRVLDPAGRPIGTPNVPDTTRRLLFDRSGALWLATAHGIVRFPGGDAGRPASPDASGIERFSSAQGLSGTDVFDIWQDREANIWVGTSGGLDLFRETSLVPAEFPARMHATRLAPGRDGAVWAGSRDHPLLHLSNGVVTATNVPPPVTAVHSDRDGIIWAWGAGRLWRSDGGPFVRLATAPAGRDVDAVSLSGDHLGRVWVSFLDGDLYIYAPDGWSTPWVRGLPMKTGRVRVTLAEAGGRMWLGYNDSRVVAVLGDRVETFSAERGLRVGSVNAITGTYARMWIGGSLGTAVIENGRVHMVTGLDDAAIGGIRGVVESSDGSLWLNATRGVVSVPAEEVRQLLRDRSYAPPFRVFDYLDGVIGGAAPIPPQAAIRGSDGRLWFVGYDNVVSLAPDRITSNALPPPVHIQSMRAGSTEYDAGAPVRLPVGASQIQVAYTALSLAIPNRVHFRVRLDGVDRTWQDVGSRREAFYTNLGPGSYTFRVIAANNDGLWNETGAQQAFVIPPALHQTSAFRAGALLAGVALAWGWYRMRLRQVTAQVRANLAERLSERERIARELHDTLLQGLQGLILKFQAVAARLPSGDPAAVMMEQTLERADRVLVESRDRVRDLRASARPGLRLASALERAASDVITGATPAFRVVIQGSERPLDPIVCDEAYWIGREAVLNAAQHARPTRIEVEVGYSASELRVRCRDNGDGFEPEQLVPVGGVHHWGLVGMNERARQMGAQLDIWSRPGLGTVVDLRVPAATAYRQQSRSWLGWLRRGTATR